MSTPNAPELRRVMEHIEANQDRWWQGAWRVDLDLLSEEQRAESHKVAECGTAFCFAGWKCELDGVTWKSPSNSLWDSSQIITADGLISAEDYAAEALGLTDEQAEDLFHPDNAIDDLRRIVAELCAEAEGA